MMRILSFSLWAVLSLASVELAAGTTSARIIQLEGDVKIRRGLEESWSRADLDMLLEDIDTILTGERGEVVLRLGTGKKFRLGSNAIVDIGDLRKISERELFLLLMSEKVGRLTPAAPDGKLRIANVSVVRAENKAHTSKAKVDDLKALHRVQETNGARAMYAQKFYPNAIVKFHRILQKNPGLERCSEIYYYLGKSFEKIGEPGRALDAYRTFMHNAENTACWSALSMSLQEEVKSAVERLKK